MAELGFPEGMRWGTGTAAHQVEGNTRNDWTRAEEQGKIKHRSGEAAEHYERFREDFRLAKEMGQNSHRFSIEWSRLEPKPGEFDMGEVAHYREVLQALKDEGMESFVTLHHFTNPEWFADSGGFANRQNLVRFEKYAEFCAQNFGDLVDVWTTINEPNIYINQAYLDGKWPPFKTDLRLGLLTFRNMAEAHNRAYEAIHEEIPEAKVGAVVQCITTQSVDRNPVSKLVAAATEYINNNAFYKMTKGRHDYLGINYYFNVRMSWNKKYPDLRGTQWEKEAEGGVSDLGWEVRPEGIYEVVTDLHRKMPELPIYITENGIADASDTKREGYIKEHLRQLHRAITEGVPIRGYFYWTLFDNFEWAEGYEPKFGLMTINRELRPSANFFRQVCLTNKMPE